MKVVHGSKFGKYTEKPGFTPIYSQKMHLFRPKPATFRFEARIQNLEPVWKTFITEYGLSVFGQSDMYDIRIYIKHMWLSTSLNIYMYMDAF